MSTDTEKPKSTSARGVLAREMTRMDQERASLRQSMTQSLGAMQQLRESFKVGSAYSQLTKDLSEIHSATSVIGQQYKEMLAEMAAGAQALKAWQAAQREQQEHIRKMLEPLAEIRKSFIVDDPFRRQLSELTLGSSLRDQFKDAMASVSGISSVANMWARQMEEVREQARSAFVGITAGSPLSQQLRHLEQINKQWHVAPELIDVVSPLKELHSQIGKLTLPSIDWGSAVALAKLLGREGLEEQLAHLGIKADGSLHATSEAPEKGLLSRKQSDAIAILGLLLGVISIWMAIQMFYSQEQAGAAQQAKNDEQAARQMRQLESLNLLVEKALKDAANDREERFVVRERVATVRSKPEHGSSVEGKLMPNEVVRAVDRDGKWIEVDYYHWLREEYRTGWVLKKYLERVPANYVDSASRLDTESNH